jgi:hypothetical protein
MRQIVGGRAKERAAASTSLMGRFETETLTQSKNLQLLMDLSGIWENKVHQRKRNTICAKVGIRRKQSIKSRDIVEIFYTITSKSKIFDSSRLS